MSIEINEMLVKTTVDEGEHSDYGRNKGNLYNDLEKIKARILSECKELFYELLDEQKER